VLPRDLALDGVFARVVGQGKPLIANALSAQPEAVCFPGDRTPLGTLLLVPLRRGGSVVGMIALADKPAGFGSADQSAVEALADALVLALGRARAQAALCESQRTYRLLFDKLGAPALIFDAETMTVVDGNDRALHLLGRRREQLVGAHYRELHAPQAGEQCMRQLGACLSSEDRVSYECELRQEGGAAVPVMVDAVSMRLGERRAMLVVLHDVSEHKHAERTLRTLSLRDELTGVLNRRGFIEAATRGLEQARSGKQSCVLWFVDLDRLKQINDSNGHAEGDLALCRVASVLSRTFRDSDLIGRIGGDEFVVLALGMGAGGVAGARSHLREALGAHNRAGDRPFTLSVSLGTAVFEPQGEARLPDLLEAADRNL
jgi:diguanylate cyclase (GGDEF)-like protein/PAS domain S-box-containing protein